MNKDHMKGITMLLEVLEKLESIAVDHGLEVLGTSNVRIRAGIGTLLELEPAEDGEWVATPTH